MELYLFGQRNMDTQVRNAVITEVVRLVSLETDDRKFFSPVQETVNKTFDETPAKDPLRRLLVDIQVNWSSRMLENDEDYVHPEFLLEVARSYCDKATHEVDYNDWRMADFDANDYLV